jgi:hypothetical protein
LRARKIGTQHVIEPADLDEVLAVDELPVPESWGVPMTDRPLPSVVAVVRAQRSEH